MDKLSWIDFLDDRSRKEVEFSRLYAKEYGHGTTGHNQLMLIAKLSDLLFKAEQAGFDFEELERQEANTNE